MKIKTKILWTLLGMSLLVALVGALAVNRQRASAIVAVTKEAEDVARTLSFLISDSNKLPAIQEIVARLHQTQGRDVTLVDPQQRIFADAIPAEIGRTYSNDQFDEVGATIKDRQVRTFLEISKAYPAGIKQIVVPVEAADGQVLGAVILEYTPLYNELMRLTDSTTRQVVSAAFGSVVLAMLIAVYMGGSVATPLQQLTNAATRFAAGETNLPMPRSRGDEIGKLANAFYDMVQRRCQAEDELRRTRDGFEVRVVERTAELAAANIFLQQEVTERRVAEEAMRSSERRFSQLAEAIPDVFWITSKDMEEIIYVSPAYEKIWGRTLESLRQQPLDWVDAIIEEDRAGLFEKFTTLPQSKGMVSAEYRIRRSDGEVRWIQDHGFPIYDEKGEFYRVAGVARDITERKQMEARLFEVGKLETVGRLAAGIAHDFNTILTTVIGHAELIANKLSPGSPEFQSATQIGVSAARAALLTQQLLAFSRKQMLQPEVIDLNAAVKDADSMLRRFLGDAIEVRIAINAQQPLAKVDLGQIQQMLVQLASNARDAMPSGGRLTLETADMTLDENYAATHADVVAGDFVMIAISDTGAGIAPHVKPHLFEPFFTTKPQGEGTGLGLAMCYGIVKQNGGHISVYSEPGHGSTFKIFLPRISGSPSEAADSRAPIPIPKETPTHGSESILLVEDDDGLRDLAGIVLSKLGYTVHPAANGAEALSIAEKHEEISLLLTDVVMPQMSGKELADRLCALRPSIKVLFTSAFTEDAIAHHGILDQGIDFLHKPYTPALLSRKTREALDAR